LTRLRLLSLLVPLVSLGACHKAPKNDQRSASGEVLQGTTSDAMIPLGQLTSQPPLLLAQGKAPTTPEQAAAQGSGEASTTDVSSGALDQTTTAAPAATPSSAPASSVP
jgi:hypothetical protein